MTDILDLIDSAVADWTVSGDAMRCSPDAPVAEPVRPYFAAALAEHQAQIFATFAGRCDALAAGLRQMNEHIVATAGSFRQFNLAWQANRISEPDDGHSVQVDRWTGRRHRRRRRQ